MLPHADLMEPLGAGTGEGKPHQVDNISLSEGNHEASPSQMPRQPEFGILLQSSCHLHRYTRNESDAHIVERADRLRSVLMGVAIAHGRLTATSPDKGKSRESTTIEEVNDLEKLLEGMNIGPPERLADGWPFSISSTPRRLKLDSPAVHLAHGAEYASRLAGYINNVAARHAQKESEVPEPLSQGDLYLCQESLDALEGALGACCEAVDQICSPSSPAGSSRFVSIRPPGHHCEYDNPMGFCWVNNVAVAAAHGTGRALTIHTSVISLILLWR